MFDFSCDWDWENVYEIANITPVDAKIYYEDNTPYLDYVGEALAPDNTRIKIHIPKVKLSFPRFYCKRRGTQYRNGVILNFEANAVLDGQNEISFQIVEREMTKEQVEKELGYKINIKE